MKFKNSLVNPLQELFNFLPEGAPMFLTKTASETIESILAKGGIMCESSVDIVQCLKLLGELKAIHFEEVDGEDDNKYFKIGQVSNGQ